MNCLLVAATPFEIAPFLDHYRDSAKPFFVDFNLDVLISGIGLMATTYNLQKQVQLKRPDLVIQAGIGGCFDGNIPLGKVVAIKQDTIADQGVTEKKQVKTVFDMRFASADQFPYKKGWLTNPDKGIAKRSRLPLVKAISVNQVTSSRKTSDLYINKFDAVVESMEGAALHYVCLMEKIPFLQLRALSNYVGERNKKKWQLNKSITQLNQKLIQLLESL